MSGRGMARSSAISPRSSRAGPCCLLGQQRVAAAERRLAQPTAQPARACTGVIVDASAPARAAGSPSRCAACRARRARTAADRVAADERVPHRGRRRPRDEARSRARRCSRSGTPAPAAPSRVASTNAMYVQCPPAARARRPPRRAAVPAPRARVAGVLVHDLDTVGRAAGERRTTAAVLAALGTRNTSSSPRGRRSGRRRHRRTSSQHSVYCALPGRDPAEVVGQRRVQVRRPRPGPRDRALPRWLTSKTPTRSRTAVCSATTPPPAYSSGIDQPPKSPSLAPSAHVALVQRGAAKARSTPLRRRRRCRAPGGDPGPRPAARRCRGPGPPHPGSSLLARTEPTTSSPRVAP